MQRSFTEVILTIISVIYFVFGIFHLIFTKQAGLFVMYGVNGEIAAILQKFLGGAYLLIALLLFLLRKAKGSSLYITIGGVNIIGFIHLYLLFLFNNIIPLSLIYFIFIALVQICLFFSIFEQVNKR
tara:strand:- start:441 stop:821 length:381 start_codon:yes stop_codon:yes gene_type:complete